MYRRLRSIAIMATIALVALFALLPVAGAAPRAAETKTVNMANFKFDPPTITVNVGDTITWKNNDQALHTATADDGTFDTGDVAAGKEASVTLNKAGTFAYYCKYHGGPGGKGMSGTITVQEAAAQPQPTAAPAAQPTTAPAAPAAPAGATGELVVSDQAVKNGSITVSKATISVDGWVVVHKAGPDGKLLLTPVIGMTQLKAGTANNVVIKLTEDVAVGAPLWPMLHIDEGTKGTYEFPNGPDTPVGSPNATVKIAVAAAGGTAGGPSQLPRTGGDDAPVGLLLAALALLAVGTLVTLRMRRHA
jgi:LPXTG-motif cell wall-anchored protein